MSLSQFAEQPNSLPVLPDTKLDDSLPDRLDGSKPTQSRRLSMPGWLISMVVHAIILIVFATLTVPGVNPLKRLFVSMPSLEDIAIEPELPEEFRVSDIPVDEAGSLSDGSDALAAASLAADISELPDVTMPNLPQLPSVNPLDPSQAIEIATGTDFSKTFVMKGSSGVNVKGASGAIDRLTHELLVSMEERPTLVAWLFDQSGSLNRQRKEVTNRFDAIYEQIGTVSATGVFSRFEEEPLLSTIVAFGKQTTFCTPKPTNDPQRLSQAVREIEEDKSGIENVFQAVRLVVEEFRRYRKFRNVIIIIFSDEVGDDQHLLDETVDRCRRLAIPVYVVGVPAPFGQVESMVKWIDPNPKFSQEPQWGRVNQGPESLLPERIQLAFADSYDGEPPIDSGFGPYALTRLCYQTGGIYFTVHPNRRIDRPVRARETSPFAAHFRRFFDEETMRRYKPDYVSAQKYRERVKQLSSREALVTAANESWLEPMENPQQRFSAKTEAEFAKNLTEAQKTAAKLEPKLDRLYRILDQGSNDRQREDEARWQAGYDLAMGRTLATLVRTRAYNAILAEAKRGLTPKNEQTNVWLLRPSSTIESGSELKRMAEEARKFLQRVIEEHPKTPWSALAKRELKFPLGWSWSEFYVQPREERIRMQADNNQMPTDEQRRMLEKRKPRRDVPRL